MNESDPLEKQLRSWTPRRPSPKVAERLFGKTRPGAVARSQMWNWLTPVAACALTALVVVRGPMRYGEDFEGQPTSAAITTVMYDPEASNAQRTFVLSRADINVELNAWPHLGPWQPTLRAPQVTPVTNRTGISAEL